MPKKNKTNKKHNDYIIKFDKDYKFVGFDNMDQIIVTDFKKSSNDTTIDAISISEYQEESSCGSVIKSISSYEPPSHHKEGPTGPTGPTGICSYIGLTGPTGPQGCIGPTGPSNACHHRCKSRIKCINIEFTGYGVCGDPKCILNPNDQNLCALDLTTNTLYKSVEIDGVFEWIIYKPNICIYYFYSINNCYIYQITNNLIIEPLKCDEYDLLIDKKTCLFYISSEERHYIDGCPSCYGNCPECFNGTSWIICKNSSCNTGASGCTGQMDPLGCTGETGPTGCTGEMGPHGFAGEMGPPGCTGEMGPTGCGGEMGPPGCTGEMGPPGCTGEMGPTGCTGEMGPPGCGGEMGPVGPMGLAGPAGVNGSKIHCLEIVYSGIAVCDSSTLSLILPTDTDQYALDLVYGTLYISIDIGNNNYIWTIVSQQPLLPYYFYGINNCHIYLVDPSTQFGSYKNGTVSLFSDGFIGDFIMDTLSGNMYMGSLSGCLGVGCYGDSCPECNDGIQWIFVANLSGCTGTTGPQGQKGDLGPTGQIGSKGDTGPTGHQGLKGDIGPTGLNGSKGDPGSTGHQGLKGDTGPTGQIGLKGDTGPTGQIGLKGDTGLIGPTGAPGNHGCCIFSGDLLYCGIAVCNNSCLITNNSPTELNQYALDLQTGILHHTDINPNPPPLYEWGVMTQPSSCYYFYAYNNCHIYHVNPPSQMCASGLITEIGNMEGDLFLDTLTGNIYKGGFTGCTGVGCFGDNCNECIDGMQWLYHANLKGSIGPTGQPGPTGPQFASCYMNFYSTNTNLFIINSKGTNELSLPLGILNGFTSNMINTQFTVVNSGMYHVSFNVNFASPGQIATIGISKNGIMLQQSIIGNSTIPVDIFTNINHNFIISLFELDIISLTILTNLDSGLYSNIFSQGISTSLTIFKLG